MHQFNITVLIVNRTMLCSITKKKQQYIGLHIVNHHYTLNRYMTRIITIKRYVDDQFETEDQPWIKQYS